MQTKIILASQSPRRHELFAKLDLPFRKFLADIDETANLASNPEAFAQKMALLKAETLAHSWKDHTVVGADTVVAMDGRILGKPEREERAWEMLRLLNGRRHLVVTGVAVVNLEKNFVKTGVKVTGVEFHQVSEKELGAYIKSGEPLDKAGGYGIQGKGRSLVRSVQGCHSNVVGLPLCLLVEFLRKAGLDRGAPWDEAASRCCSLP